MKFPTSTTSADEVDLNLTYDHLVTLYYNYAVQLSKVMVQLVNSYPLEVDFSLSDSGIQDCGDRIAASFRTYGSDINAESMVYIPSSKQGLVGSTKFHLGPTKIPNKQYYKRTTFTSSLEYGAWFAVITPQLASTPLGKEAVTTGRRMLKLIMAIRRIIATQKNQRDEVQQGANIAVNASSYLERLSNRYNAEHAEFIIPDTDNKTVELVDGSLYPNPYFIKGAIKAYQGDVASCSNAFTVDFTLSLQGLNDILSEQNQKLVDTIYFCIINRARHLPVQRIWIADNSQGGTIKPTVSWVSKDYSEDRKSRFCLIKTDKGVQKVFGPIIASIVDSAFRYGSKIVK